MNLSLFPVPKSMSPGSSGEGQPLFNKPEHHLLPVFLRSHQTSLLSWLKIIREVATVPGTDWVGTMNAFHTTLLRKISNKCVFSLHFATEFLKSYLLTHQNVFQGFSTAWEHPLALVCDPHKCVCHLGAYCLDVGRDAYINRYLWREMHAFLPSILTLFVHQRENKVMKAKVLGTVTGWYGWSSRIQG